MRAFLITFKPKDESPVYGWFPSEMRRLAQSCESGRSPEQIWRFRNKRDVQLGDRVFLILQGKKGPAVIGYGRVCGGSRLDGGQRCVPVKFESIVDPTVRVLLGRPDVLSIRGGENFWRSQSSGVLLPESVANKLEALVVARKSEAQLRQPYKSEIIYPDELIDGQSYWEGAVARVEVNRYERDRAAREACLKIHGKQCKVCGLRFEDLYGEIGKGFIQVHHLKPLATAVGSYQIEPDKDLVPVCPNCHAMLHIQDPKNPISIAQLRSMLRVARSK